VTTTLRRLFGLADAPRSRLALVAVLGATTVLCGVGLMSTAGYLISRAAERPEVLSLTVAIVAVRFFGLARPIVRYLERLSAHDLALRALARARVRAYEHIEPLAPAQLEGYRRGDLLARMVADVDALQNLHLRAAAPPLAALIAGTVSVGVTAAFLPSAAIVLACGLLAAGVVAPAATALLGARSGTQAVGAAADVTAELVESLRGAPELAVFGRTDVRLREVQQADRLLVSSRRRASLADGAGDGLRLLVTGVTVAGVLAFAVNAHASGQLDRVLVAALALLALASFEAVQPLPQAARELAETLASGRRILAVTDREPRVADPPQPAPLPAGPFAVALEHVTARYEPGGPPVLDDFDLRLGPGSKVALLGASGSGKTTVTSLLLRFIDPDAGRVSLAGRDLREYRQEDVRRVIAVAGQESHLFSASIRDNVRLARPEASDAELEEALRRARIWDWVSALPDGWHTLVGEEGRELSGGQRQRIVVARALLADAPVLVLDEPTAHLDPPTAERLMHDVLAAAGDRSVLLITHRPEGLELMDEVVTLT
jgi:ATP-binding cassette, subfamily C, bacterial CydC